MYWPVLNCLRGTSISAASVGPHIDTKAHRHKVHANKEAILLLPDLAYIQISHSMTPVDPATCKPPPSLKRNDASNTAILTPTGSRVNPLCASALTIPRLITRSFPTIRYDYTVFLIHGLSHYSSSPRKANLWYKTLRIAEIFHYSRTWDRNNAGVTKAFFTNKRIRRRVGTVCSNIARWFSGK